MNDLVNSQAAQFKQPEVIKFAFLTTICERFGFYVLSYLLVLYVKATYGLADSAAYALFSVFTAFAFLTPALGGWLGDNFLGLKRCVLWGLVLEGTGLVLLSFSASSKILFYLALALVIVGVGLFKTAPTDLLARSYKKDDPRIDSGFTFFYMSINIGSLCSSLVAGIVQAYYGWTTAFLVGGIGLLSGVIFYYLFRSTSAGLDTLVGEESLPITKIITMIVGILGASIAFLFLLINTSLSNSFFIVSTIVAVIYFIFEIIKSPKEEKYKIVACLYLIFVGFLASIIYFQGFTSIELFIDRSVDRSLFGFNIPTVMYMSLNPIFVVIFAPILAYLYNKLESKKKDLTVVAKISLGLLTGSLCFFCLVIGGYYFANPVFKISSFWVVLFFILYTISDLLIGALGVAMVTRLAPKRLYGVMMGAWFLIGNALAAYVSGVFAGLSEVPASVTDPHAVLEIYNLAFTKIGMVGIILSVVIFAINPHIKRIAKIE